MAAEKKPLSDKKKESNRKYLHTLDDIKLRVPKGKRKELRKYASSAGMSLNAFILSAIEEKIRRLGQEKDIAGADAGNEENI